MLASFVAGLVNFPYLPVFVFLCCACVCVIGFEQKTVLSRKRVGLLWESKNGVPLTHDTSAKLRQRMERKGGRKKWQELQVGASYNTSGC